MSDYDAELLIQNALISRWKALDLGEMDWRYAVFRHTWPDGWIDVYSIDIANVITRDNQLFSFSLSAGQQTIEKHRKFNPCVDEAYALTTDLEEALLFAPLADGTELCIDGHHRARKALLTGVDVIYCKVLSGEQKAQCLILRMREECEDERNG